MRKKKDLIQEEDVIDAEEEGLIAERWSLTKILIGCVVLLILLGSGMYGFLSYKRYQESQGNNILGITQSRQEEQLPTEEDVEETLETVQKEIEKINPNNIFSSQESIQKIIKDLESLRQSTTDPKGAFCSAVCGTSSTSSSEKAATQEAKNK